MNPKQLYQTSDATALAAHVAAGEVSPMALLDAALEQAAEKNPALCSVTMLREDTARRQICAQFEMLTKSV